MIEKTNENTVIESNVAPSRVDETELQSNRNDEVEKSQPSFAFDHLMSLPVDVIVSVGKARLTFRQLMDLKPDSIFDLDTAISEPVEIFASGKLIARGDLIEVEGGDDGLAVRITEVLDHGEAT